MSLTEVVRFGALVKGQRVLGLTLSLVGLVLLVSSCAKPASPVLNAGTVSEAVIRQLGFDPTTVQPKHEGKIGVPGLPAGFTYREVVPSGKYAGPDVMALDPSEKFLYFVAKDEGSVYRVDLANGQVIRLVSGLHRPGGIAYYQPGQVLLVSEEGTGDGPEERKLGFWYAVRPDVADQPKPLPLRAMGQYRGEGFWPAGADTIYLCDDHPDGGHVYKYVPDAPPDLTKGTLYVFKENQGWIKTAYLEAPDTGKEGTKFYGAEGIEIGPDGRLYVTLSATAENRVIAIDLATFKVTNFVTAATKGFDKPDQLRFGPTGVLFMGEKAAEGDVWAALPDGPDADTLSDGVYRLLTGMPLIESIVFTKDGSTVYVPQKGQVNSILAISGFKYR